MAKYTMHEFQQVEYSWTIHKIIGHPSTCTFFHLIENNLFSICLVALKDILATQDTFAPTWGTEG